MIKLGLIGTGKWGRRYLDTCERLHSTGLVDAQITALCRKSPEERDIDIPPGTRWWALWEDVIAWASIDGVIIATPPQIHYRMAAVALAAGKPLLVEKPATLSLRETEGLLHLARAKNVPAKVGHLHLSSPAFRRLHEEVQGRSICRIVSRGHGHGPYRDYSALWDWGPHDLSMVIALLGINTTYNITKVEATKSGSGSAWTFEIDAGGAFVQCTVGNIFPGKARYLCVNTTDGSEYIYDDIGEKKLTINGSAISLRDEKALDNQLRDFIATCEMASLLKSGLMPIPINTELEAAVKIATILEKIERKWTEMP